MYNKLFNEELQLNMTKFFLEELAVLGSKRVIKKNESLNPKDSNHIYIVLDGSFNQVLYGQDGHELSFFRLVKGTIFGEMDYFEGYRTCMITKALENSIVSVVPREILDNKLLSQPDIYKQFIHSIIRKYRIVMLELADIKFNDSLGKLAHVILRWGHITNYSLDHDISKKSVSMSLTHEEVANRLASNRTTITNGLNHFKEKGLIKIEDKRIFIMDSDGLKKYTNGYWVD